MFVISTQSSSDKMFGEAVKGIAQLLKALERLSLALIVEPFNRHHKIFEEL